MDSNAIHFIMAACAGVALATACGFRVFLPLLAMAIASHVGHGFHPSPATAWVASPAALVVLGMATIVEIAAYYVPWLDHMLDTIATPAAIGAGVLAMAAALPGGVDPSVRWALAAAAGGGAAGVTQAGTVAARATSGVTTGGLGNPLVSTIELIGAVGLSILAIVVPLLAGFLVAAVFVLIIRKFIAWRRNCRERRNAIVEIAPA